MVALDLDANGLDGSLPGSVFTLPWLQELHVANNRLHGAFPADAEASDHLRVRGSVNSATPPTHTHCNPYTNF